MMVGVMLLALFLARESRKGWQQNYLKRLHTEGIWLPNKHGKEEDVESRQLSLAGAIEANK